MDRLVMSSPGSDMALLPLRTKKEKGRTASSKPHGRGGRVPEGEVELEKSAGKTLSRRMVEGGVGKGRSFQVAGRGGKGVLAQGVALAKLNGCLPSKNSDSGIGVVGPIGERHPRSSAS